MIIMALRNAVLVICLLWSSAMCMPVPNEAGFSSLLRTVVDDAAVVPAVLNQTVPPVFRIYGPNAYIVQAYYLNESRLIDMDYKGTWENFTYNSDGTLQVYGKCMAVVGLLNQGSLVRPTDCNTADKNASTWDLDYYPRQITLRYNKLVITAVSGKTDTRLTVELNMFSSYQTWRLDYNPSVSTAKIIGMNQLCLKSGFYDVWLAECSNTTTDSTEKWLIYPDGTIRPDQRPQVCLTVFNTVENFAVVGTCGVAPTNERWRLKQNGQLIIESLGRALDVAEAKPELKKILAYPASKNPGPNQKWSIHPL